MKKNTALKGITLLGVLIVAVLIILAGLGGYFLGRGGFGFGGGKGDGIGSGDAVAADVTVTEETDTTFSTEEIEYIEITVSENTYIIGGITYEMDKTEEIVNLISAAEDIAAVRITDSNASLKAYEKLTKALTEHNIKFIEVS
ncbi:MAG: hypothetical protein NC120_07605 [Ruminococcus sp.]|nr:hypothetical protein [Ruminococcus sp.]